ncbi:hypothetical protein DPMN_134283 [Dreissena polymorpha]|uniref:Uncharacterized protein n=1 Tax=Dreissena polymorpha TaxID=45954 RepID=A0A9D4FVY6_DREPO|nr:hypothetical protein DPMN_134283 [Dreissena polymorpha]
MSLVEFTASAQLLCVDCCVDRKSRWPWSSDVDAFAFGLVTLVCVTLVRANKSETPTLPVDETPARPPSACTSGPGYSVADLGARLETLIAARSSLSVLVPDLSQSASLHTDSSRTASSSSHCVSNSCCFNLSSCLSLILLSLCSSAKRLAFAFRSSVMADPDDAELIRLATEHASSSSGVFSSVAVHWENRSRSSTKFCRQFPYVSSKYSYKNNFQQGNVKRI